MSRLIPDHGSIAALLGLSTSKMLLCEAIARSDDAAPATKATGYRARGVFDDRESFFKKELQAERGKAPVRMRRGGACVFDPETGMSVLRLWFTHTARARA